MNDLSTELPNEVPEPKGSVIAPTAPAAWAEGQGDRMIEGNKFLAAPPDPPTGKAPPPNAKGDIRNAVPLT